MRVFFDTEFMEDGKTIELLSIGMVREDGKTYYAECAEADRSRANPWVQANVLPHLMGPVKPRAEIRADILAFVGHGPWLEFWAYYAAYDWVALCQLFGTMMDLPLAWPKYCHDLRVFFDQQGARSPSTGQPGPPIPEEDTHHALADAKWAERAFLAVTIPTPYLKRIV